MSEAAIRNDLFYAKTFAREAANLTKNAPDLPICGARSIAMPARNTPQSKQSLCDRTVMKRLSWRTTKTLLLLFAVFASTAAQAEVVGEQQSNGPDFSSCVLSRENFENIPAQSQTLCIDQSERILIEYQGDGRGNTGLMGDATPLFDNFYLLDGQSPNYTISFKPTSFSSRVWQAYFTRKDGNEESTRFLYFVWTRDVMSARKNRGRYEDAFGSSRTIKCYHDLQYPHGFESCITYYTAPVCDEWHSRWDMPFENIGYPVIAVRTERYEDSLYMMENFEAVHKTVENMLAEVLKISCGG